MVKKQPVQILILVLLVSVMIFQAMSFARAQTREDSQDLSYGEMIGFEADAERNIVWEFQSSEDDVCITVLVMDEENGKKFQDDKDFEADVQSEGDKTEDSGEYEVEDPGTYFIVFLNNDSSKKDTTVDYKIAFDESGTGGLFIYALFFGIIAAIAVVVVIVIVLVLRKQKRKERGISTPQPLYSPQPYAMPPPAQAGPYPQPQAQPAPSPGVAPVPTGPSTEGVKFCPNCRAKISNPNAVFCTECGANLKV